MTGGVVDVAMIAGSVAANDLSIWGLVAQADIVVKSVMFSLLFASFWCWSIIYDRWTYFRKLNYKTKIFEKAYKSSNSFKSLYSRIHGKDPGCAMAYMFAEGVYISKKLPLSKKDEVNSDLLSCYKEKILNSVIRVKNENLEKMEKNLIILASVASASPFIGLFGTVWGIVNSFQAIAATKNTTLAVVAPGIAEALLATALGLFAAIPAVIFYNLFS